VKKLIWILVAMLIATIAVGASHGREAATDNIEVCEDLSLLNSVFDILKNTYYDESKVSTDVLVQGAIEGMLATLDDEHTSYMPREEFEEMQTDIEGQFGGLGMLIGIRDDILTILSLVEGSPAGRSDLKPGDRIIKIDGKSIEGLTIEEAVKLLRGEVGSKVKLTITRESSTRSLNFTLIRAIIKVESVKSDIIDDSIGYIHIAQFGKLTAMHLRKHLYELKEKNINALIVDVRNNPGGFLTSAIEITDLFLQKGIIVSTKGRDPAEDQTFEAHANAILPNMPLIVLINKGSASAAEIFAAAIKDNHRGFLLGQKTFGKSSVQEVWVLPNGAGLRVTAALYYTPTGELIHKKGVMPDKIVEAVEIPENIDELIEIIEEFAIIKDFVATHTPYTDEEFEELTQLLLEHEIQLEPRLVRKLIRMEVEKYDVPKLIDLDYDIQLQYAINMLQTINAFLETQQSR